MSKYSSSRIAGIGPTWFERRQLGLRNPLGTRDFIHEQMYSSIFPCEFWDGTTNNSNSSVHGGVFCLEFSPEGSILVAAYERRSVLLFDPLTYKEIHAIENAHHDCVNCVKFLDSRTFATCSDDFTVALWDVRNLTKKVRSFKGHTNWVKNIEYCPQDGLLVTSGFDGNILTWEMNKYREGGMVYNKVFGTNGLMRTCLTPDASKLIMCTTGGYLIVIHNLDLHTLTQDMDGFKPNMYRLMQLSQTVLPIASDFTPLFRGHGKRNRVEFITDFPTGDDAEVVSSLQVHPDGHSVISRNVSNGELSEWSCIHNIEERLSSDDSDSSDVEENGFEGFESVSWSGYSTSISTTPSYIIQHTHTQNDRHRSRNDERLGAEERDLSVSPADVWEALVAIQEARVRRERDRVPQLLARPVFRRQMPDAGGILVRPIHSGPEGRIFETRLPQSSNTAGQERGSQSRENANSSDAPRRNVSSNTNEANSSGRSAASVRRSTVPAARIAVPIGRSTVPAGRIAVPIGRSTVPAGRIVGPIGRSTVPASAISVSAGRSPSSAGRAAASGRSASSAGRSSSSAGKSTVSTGTSTSSAGKTSTSVGRSKASIGTSTSSAGRSTVSIGTSTSAGTSSSAGKCTVSTGTSTSPVGKSTSSAGTSTSSAGASVDPGRSSEGPSRTRSQSNLRTRRTIPARMRYCSLYRRSLVGQYDRTSISRKPIYRHRVTNLRSRRLGSEPRLHTNYEMNETQRLQNEVNQNQSRRANVNATASESSSEGPSSSGSRLREGSRFVLTRRVQPRMRNPTRGYLPFTIFPSPAQASDPTVNTLYNTFRVIESNLNSIRETVNTFEGRIHSTLQVLRNFNMRLSINGENNENDNNNDSSNNGENASEGNSGARNEQNVEEAGGSARTDTNERATESEGATRNSETARTSSEANSSTSDSAVSQSQSNNERTILMGVFRAGNEDGVRGTSMRRHNIAAVTVSSSSQRSSESSDGIDRVRARSRSSSSDFAGSSQPWSLVPINKKIHQNIRRLTHYIEEPNLGKGFIKELSISPDGRVICSPFGNGIRLLSFSPTVQDLSHCYPRGAAIPLHELSLNMAHTDTVLSTRFSPFHNILVSGCLSGKIVYYQPLL